MRRSDNLKKRIVTHMCTLAPALLIYSVNIAFIAMLTAEPLANSQLTPNDMLLVLHNTQAMARASSKLLVAVFSR
jgi:hypothetical protein